MCGAAEVPIIKAEPALTLNTVTLNSMTVPSGSHATISTLCLPTGQPLTEASLLLQGSSPSPPTISIQDPPSPLPYTVTLALPPTNNTTFSSPLSLSALLPCTLLPPTRSPLLSISEVTNTLLDQQQ